MLTMVGGPLEVGVVDAVPAGGEVNVHTRISQYTIFAGIPELRRDVTPQWAVISALIALCRGDSGR